MNTREKLIRTADLLIREVGYNAFSFHEISRRVGIKTASIHYYFPTKSDLAVAVIQEQLISLRELMEGVSKKTPEQKLRAFFLIYQRIVGQHQVCLVGSMAPDWNTFDAPVQKALLEFSSSMLSWLEGFLEEGRVKGIFYFAGTARTRALLLVASMIAGLQIIRLTGPEDLSLIQEQITYDLTHAI